MGKSCLFVCYQGETLDSDPDLILLDQDLDSFLKSSHTSWRKLTDLRDASEG